MKLTKQDLLTFVFGLASAALVVLAEAVATWDTDTDLRLWGTALGSGLIAAGMRYIATYLAQRGVDG